MRCCMRSLKLIGLRLFNNAIELDSRLTPNGALRNVGLVDSGFRNSIVPLSQGQDAYGRRCAAKS